MLLYLLLNRLSSVFILEMRRQWFFVGGWWGGCLISSESRSKSHMKNVLNFLEFGERLMENNLWFSSFRLIVNTFRAIPSKAERRGNNWINLGGMGLRDFSNEFSLSKGIPLDSTEIKGRQFIVSNSSFILEIERVLRLGPILLWRASRIHVGTQRLSFQNPFCK